MRSLMIGIIAGIITMSAASAEMIRPIARPTIEHCPENDTDQQQCLLCNVYHEARGETIYGQLAVLFVTMNRVNSDEYPDTICEVVWQKGWSRSANRWIGQFSWTYDGASDRMTDAEAVQQMRLAIDRFNRMLEQDEIEVALELTTDVLWYHTDGVSPRWSRSLEAVVMIDNHQFFRRP